MFGEGQEFKYYNAEESHYNFVAAEPLVWYQSWRWKEIVKEKYIVQQ